LGYNLTYTHFTLFRRNRRERLFFLTSARVPICLADGASWHMVKISGKSRYHLFQGLKETNNDYITFHKTNTSQTGCTQQDVIMVIK
jgi:hypothetical protein